MKLEINTEINEKEKQKMIIWRIYATKKWMCQEKIKRKFILFCYFLNFFNWSILELQCHVLVSGIQQSESYTYIFTYVYIYIQYMHIHTFKPFYFFFFLKEWIEFPVLYSRSLLVICSTYSSIYLSILSSQFALLPSLTPW